MRFLAGPRSQRWTTSVESHARLQAVCAARSHDWLWRCLEGDVATMEITVEGQGALVELSRAAGMSGRTPSAKAPINAN